MDREDKPKRPLIRWAGSKRKLLIPLSQSLPDSFDRYIEPFCGSACLFFHQSPKSALLCDINNELINCFQQIKRNTRLYEKLIELPKTEDYYYKLRSTHPEQLNVEQRAIRFLYLNRFCFNGVYRTNMKGEFNVPRGRNTGDFPEKVIFDSARRSLKNASLKNQSYEVTLSSLSKGDFAYIDPPYSSSTRFTGEYGIGSFTSGKLPDFISHLNELDQTGVKFLFSYRLCVETTSKLKDRFLVQELPVKRHIAGFKRNWNQVTEILVKNYEN